MAHCSLFNLKMNVTKSYLFLHNSSTLSSKNLAQTWQFRRNWTKNVYKKKKEKGDSGKSGTYSLYVQPLGDLTWSTEHHSSILLSYNPNSILLPCVRSLLTFAHFTVCPYAFCTFSPPPTHTHSHVSDLWFIGTHTHSDTPLHPDTWGIAVPPILRFWLSKIEFLLKMLLANEQADGQNV